MMFLAYPFLAVASVLFAALTMILAPLLALFVGKDGNLPGLLRLFQTFDATCFEGRQPQYGFTGSDWWVACRWLWRNPGYSLDRQVLGCAFDPAQWRVIAYRPDGSLFIAIGPGGRFNLCGRIGLRFKFGWKAWNMWDDARWKTQPWGPDWRIPICCTISR